MLRDMAAMAETELRATMPPQSQRDMLPLVLERMYRSISRSPIALKERMGVIGP